MIVTEIPSLFVPPVDDPNRPKGLHLSHIIHDLMVRLEPKRYDHSKQSPEEAQAGYTKIQSGLTFEQVFEDACLRGLYPQLFRPAPLQVDGIWMSPDGFDPVEGAIHEYKLTWYSSRKICPTDNVYWPWVVQVKCYTRAVHSLLAYLTAFHINGNYAPPRPVPPRTWRLVFTQFELDECWDMVTKHAKNQGML
jgi:hypothetical protein